ncbi:hypothetical protein BH11PSE14_BH11PSE14_09010 [soil metagenome]
MDRLPIARVTPTRRVAHAALLSLSLVLLAGAPARAAETLQCPQWRVPASFTIIQTNGPQVTFELNQNGSALSGRAHYGSVSGRAEGSIVGTAFSARALWIDSGLKSIGNYAGQIRPRTLYGQIGPTTVADIYDGVTYDEYISPHEPAGFVMHDLSCTYPAPGKALGRVKLPGPVGFGRVGTPSTERPPICDAARSARARNSPAAAGLERQCLASGGSLVPPVNAPPPPSPAIPDTNTPTTMPATVPAVDSTRIDGLAATGANIANQDTDLAYARAAEPGAAFQRGFDIATGLFGDPALGAEGRPAADQDAANIRASLGSDGQRGFDASADYQFGTQGAR